MKKMENCRCPLLTRRMAALGLAAAWLVPWRSRASHRGPEEMAGLFEAAIDRRLQLPAAEVAAYARRAGAALRQAGRTPQAAQYLMVVDRDPLVQAGLLFWRSAEGEWRLVGASPVSTGHPGPFDRRPTPAGVFPLVQSGGEPAVFDFGSQPVGRDWGEGTQSHMRLQLRPPEPAVMENRLGLAQSNGPVLVPASLAQMLLALGLLPPGSPAALVVLDSGRAERPAWSPAPHVPQARPADASPPAPAPTPPQPAPAPAVR
jgi:hypothetical protein